MVDEREFEELEPKEQEEVFRKAPLKERGILLSHSHDPEKLVHSLSQEELYLLTREVDSDEKPEIIRHADLRQLFFIADVDCWKRDQIDPDAFLRWLEALLEADHRKLGYWLTTMDYETVATGLKKIMTVIKPDWEYATDEVLGDLPSFTFDEYYHFYVTEDNLDVVKRVMQVLYEQHRGKYAALVEGMLGEITDELEEEAYRRRGIRLSERGFPDQDSAFVIYKSLTREEFENFPKKTKKSRDSMMSVEGEKIEAPTYPVLWSEDKSFLEEVLRGFHEEDPELLETLQEEIAWLSNKVIACSGLDFSSEIKVREGVRRARSMVGLGLELLSDGDIEKAKVFARERWLEVLFRWASTQQNALKNEVLALLKVYWNRSRVDSLEFFNEPYDFIVRGLLENIPVYYDGTLEKEEKSYREFQTREELERAQLAVSQLREMVAFIDTHHKMKPVDLQKKIPGIDLFSFIGNEIVLESNHKTKMRLLKKDELETFLKAKLSDVSTGVSEIAELRKNILEKRFDEEQREILRPLWALVCDQMIGEYRDRGIEGMLEFSQFFKVEKKS